MSVTEYINVVQIITFVLAILTLGVIVGQIFLQPSRKYWHVPMLLLVIHWIIFYSLLFLDRYSYLDLPPIFTIWSSYLRAHGVITIFMLEVARLITERGQNK